MKITNDQLRQEIVQRKQSEEDLHKALEERKEMELIVNLSPAVVFLWRAAEGWPVEFVSDNVQQFGYSPEDFYSGKTPFAGIIHPDDLERVTNEVAQYSQKSHKSFDQEYRIITKTGEARWIDARTWVRRNSDGVITYYQGIIMDITERKRAEAALRESEEKYRTLFEDSRDAIYVTTREGTFIDANQSALDLFGYTREEMMGLNALQIYLNPEQRSQFQQVIESKGSVRDYEVKFRKKNGIEMDCLVTSSLRRSKDGTILGYQGIIRDITEQKWAQLEKKKLEAQLRQAQKMEAIGTLAGGIAHDFNNILTPMIIHTEIAISGLAEESPVRENLQRVSQAAYRAKEVVRLILTFSRQTSAKPMPMKLSPVIKEVLKLLRASLPTTIEIRQDIKSTSDLTVADPTQIHQVLINLCTNAEHAMREKGGVLEVSLTDIDIGARDAVKYPDMKPGPYLKLTVNDTGAGMDRSVADRIFDPFFTTKQRGEGTGMGLAVVHGIVTSCGGAITVDSEPEKGTSFHVFFPRIETEVPSEIQPAGPLPTGNERILFVDDDEVVVDAVQLLLDSLDYKVVARKDGLEALEVFRAQPDEFDLVITDQTMPHMQGKELAQELMRIRPDIPIILCTGYSDQITAEEAKAIGIREYVLKPFDMEDMARIIRKVLNK